MAYAYLLIAHGSREEGSNEDFLRLVGRFTQRKSGATVVGAFLELAEPSIPEGLDRCVRSGATDIYVVPLMLFWGRHVKHDIPRFIEEAKARHPGVTFHYSGALADDEEFLAYLDRKIRSL